MPVFDILGTTTSSQFIAGVGEAASQVTTSTWLIAAFAAGIPLAFYVLYKLIALIPKGRK
jgi:hypothetical protein